MTVVQMRAYHRWLGLVSSIFMVFLGLTGLGLQLDLWITGNPAPGSDHPPPAMHVAVPPAREIGAIAAEAVQRATALKPALEVSHVDVSFMPQGAVATVGGAGPFADQVSLQATGWKVLPSKPLMPGWHNVLLGLHGGYLLGQVGRVLSAAMGCLLVILGVTGLVIYVDLYGRRARSGRPGLFWKR